jgi:hypothetical protein
VVVLELVSDRTLALVSRGTLVHDENKQAAARTRRVEMRSFFISCA